MLQKIVQFIGGAAVGAAVGVAIGIVMAPSSGGELQRTLRSFREEIIEAGQLAQEERQAELRARFNEAKQFNR